MARFSSLIVINQGSDRLGLGESTGELGSNKAGDWPCQNYTMGQIRDSAIGNTNGYMATGGPANPNADLSYSGLGLIYDRVKRESARFRSPNQYFEGRRGCLKGNPHSVLGEV